MKTLLLALALFAAQYLHAQTLGLITYDPAHADGHVLFAPIAC